MVKGLVMLATSGNLLMPFKKGWTSGLCFMLRPNRLASTLATSPAEACRLRHLKLSAEGHDLRSSQAGSNSFHTPLERTRIVIKCSMLKMHEGTSVEPLVILVETPDPHETPPSDTCSREQTRALAAPLRLLLQRVPFRSLGFL